MTQEKTKAEQFIEIASWLKRQDNEFTRNFKSMNSIIRVWKVMPESAKERKIQPWLKKEGKAMVLASDQLMLALNSEFGFRYFNKAPYRYTARLSYSKWSFNGKTHNEVKLTVIDRYQHQTYGTITLALNDLGDAKRAADRLINNNTENYKHDMEVWIADNLKDLLKNDNPTSGELKESCEIPGLAKYL